MSTIGEYLRVAPDELAKLRASTTSIVDYLYPEDEDQHPAARRLDVDKAWHAIQYLLNGSAWEGAPPRSTPSWAASRSATTTSATAPSGP